MLTNLATLVRSTEAWARFDQARVHRAALARARAELSSYRPHELSSDLNISAGDIDVLAHAEAARQLDLYLARQPRRRMTGAPKLGHLDLAGA